MLSAIGATYMLVVGLLGLFELENKTALLAQVFTYWHLAYLRIYR